MRRLTPADIVVALSADELRTICRCIARTATLAPAYEQSALDAFHDHLLSHLPDTGETLE